MPAPVAAPRQPGASPGTLYLNPSSPPTQIGVCCYGPEEIESTIVKRPVDVVPFLGRRAVTWIHVSGLGDTSAIAELGRILELHPLALEDVTHGQHRPKVETYDHTLFLIVRTAGTGRNSGQAGHEQIALFLRPGLLITFQGRRGEWLAPVHARLDRVGSRLRTNGADYLAYALLDAVIDGYFPLLERIEDELERLEERVLAGADARVLEDLYGAKRELVALRKITWPLREVLHLLLAELRPPFTEQTRVFLRDCYDHIVLVMDMVESYRDLAASVTETHRSAISQRTNEVMRMLTLIATLFMPLSFIAGVYGMNFDAGASRWNMPELHWAFGYPFALTLMLAIGVGLLWLFRRRGWL
jgi:magnesium transporter